MATYDIVLPRLGEAVIEATLIKWLVKPGDKVNEEDPIAEIATDKVDTEVFSPVSGKLISVMIEEGDIVNVGNVIAILEVEGEGSSVVEQETPKKTEPAPTKAMQVPVEEESGGTRFYSPLVRSIARKENISFRELSNLTGTGKNDRLTKKDLLSYIETRETAHTKLPAQELTSQGLPVSATDEVIEMDRVRQLIATHMISSIQTSAHVTSFIEADMTNIVRWREQHKDAFLKREGVKLTYTPILISAIAKAVGDIPMINVSVDGTKILVHKQINVGMAVALPNSNLIVPVIHYADRKSLLDITKEVNDLADRARAGKLILDEITRGTISLTNLGSFGTLMGTPIINQPEAAIVAAGAITKRPVVIETAEGDTIGIRHMMFLSVTFDHRVVDGALAGMFLNKLVGYLQQFDTKQTP